MFARMLRLKELALSVQEFAFHWMVYGVVVSTLWHLACYMAFGPVYEFFRMVKE